MVKMTGICRTGVAALALLAAVCSSAADADRIYLRWTADTNALKQASYGNVRISAEKGGAQRYLDLVCDSGSPATNALPVARVIDAVAAGAVLQAVIGDVPPIGTAENYALVLTDASWRPVAAAEPTKYESLPAGAISVQTEFGLVTPAQVDWVAGYPKPLECGFLVNGEDIASGSGTGWTYDGSVLSLTTVMTYVLSGAATNNEVQVHAAVGGATAVLSNAVVFASGRPAVKVEQGATLTAAANQVMMVGDRSDKLAYAASYKGESCVLATTGVTVTVKSGIPYVKGFTVSNAVQRIDGTPVEDGTAYRVLPGDDVYVSYTVEEGYTSKSDNPLVYLKIEGDKTVDENAISIVPQPIPYRAWNETTGQMENKECTDYVVVSNATTSFEDGKWYVVRKPVSCGTITVNGSAHLILCDGATLTANGPADNAGLAVGAGNAFAIYGQALGSGALVANGGANCAGIGSTNRQDCGSVTIHGGTVRAKGGKGGAGIGGARGGNGGTVTIHGGDLEAVGNNGDQRHGTGAGIGGSMDSHGGVVTITGGRVKAVGGATSAGIGGGTAGDGGQVTISGGYVYAAAANASGIGGGLLGKGGQVKITGGTVKAEGFWGCPDIGGCEEHGTLTIDGGSVLADLPEGLLAKNSAGRRLYCVKVLCEGLEGLVSLEGLEGLEGYGTADIYSAKDAEGDCCVCLWLPDGTYRFTLSDGKKTLRYCAVVEGMDVTVEPLELGFFVNGVRVGEGFGAGWTYDEKGVLSLSGNGPFVLSGEAANNEVQVRADAPGATVILSNAVVFASGRPALDVVQNAALLMAGGTSYLVATDNAAAAEVAQGATLTVGLAPEASRKRSMTGVFSSGGKPAIEDAGRVVVDGGRFFVRADQHAVGTPGNFTCGMDEVMMTGGTPEALTYAEACTDKPCVLVGPAVTVTVKDIPHVTDVVVSNGTERISRIMVAGGSVYRVMAGDDVFVGYKVEAGYIPQSPNPLVYREVQDDVTIDAGVIQVLPSVPYRAWNETTRQMEDRVCTNCTVVTAGTTDFEDGKWYVVTGEVSRGAIKVNGAAHLILCDGAALTCNGAGGESGEDRAGIQIDKGSALSVYGQSGGTGMLSAQGGPRYAGIGSGNGCAGDLTVDGGVISAVGKDEGAGIGGSINYDEDRGDGGTVTINGGTVTATGGFHGAGIGGGYHGNGGTVTINGGTVTAVGGDRGNPNVGNFGAGIGGGNYGDGGTVTINGGTVTARGLKWGAGIGSGSGGSGGTVTINGGRVSATGGQFGAGIGGGSGCKSFGTVRINGGTVTAEGGVDATDIGKGDTGEDSGTLTIDGGSVRAGKINIQPTNGTNAPVWRVTVKCPGLEGLVSLEGLGGYGTNDISAINGWIYLWLSDGTHRFTLSDGTTTYRYYADVRGRAITVEPLAPIGFFVNGVDIGDTPSGSGWSYARSTRMLTLDNVGPYVLSGSATNDEVQVWATTDAARVVLSNMAVFASGRPAVVVAQGATLEVAANHVMMTGGASGAMRYATTCGDAPCVLVGPAVTVTVKDIPHVKDVVVSNRTETISKAAVEGGTAYRVMKGDDIFVGYTVEGGYASKSDNPLVYRSIEGDIVVDANTIRVLPHIPYRAWNETTRQMENRVCTNYTVVTADTEIFEGGQWYAVTGAVSRGTITVNGSAHLILCDGARLTCDGAKPNAYHCGEPGILLNDPRTLSVYGQAEGTGTLEALGAEDCAGIGSGAGDSPTAGGLTVNGGVVLATGKYYGAGIGGSNTFWWKDYGNGGTVTVNGGRVTASGGPSAAGIGGGAQGRGAAVTIRGGTVASQGGQGGFGHGDGYGVSDNGSLTIDGGSVKAQTAVGLAKNSTPTNVYCVTAKVEKLKVEKLKVEGLEEYGTNDIYAVEGKVYLWLPDGAHRFSISDGVTTNRYLAVVNGGDVAAERLGPIGFFANGTDVGDAGIGDGWIYFGRVLSLTNAISYVLSGEATNNEVQVNAAASGAMAVLSNAVVFASGRPAVVVAPGATLTVAANQVMRAGETPEAMRYATDCGQNSCVLAGPAVTVTVKDIPHVTGFTVSNAVETITNATGEASCRVMAGDDVFVGYVVEEGYFSKSANPLVYAAVESDVTVDAGTIRILKNIPYRAWNEMTRQMEDKVCTNYTVVTNATTAFEDGKWYVVTNDVGCGTIRVNGAAHLILCDGATLTVRGGEKLAGVSVAAGSALAIYGQSAGTGGVIAQGGVHAAGIGGDECVSCGAVTIHGGTVTATGGQWGAGIGAGSTYRAGGVITVNGGRVNALGLAGGAGIGGGSHGTGGTLTVNGGTVSASHAGPATDIGGGGGQGGIGAGATVTINGGSVRAGTIDNVPSNGVERVYCVTAKCPGLEGLVSLEGLAGYGTNDIYAVDNRVYLWLPNGTHRFTLSDGTTTLRYCAVVRGREVTVEPLGPVGFFVNGKDIGDTGSGEGWDYSDRNLTLSDVGPYVLSGEAMNDEVQVKVATGGATVVLSNAVVFTSGRPALNIAQSAALQMAGGASYLAATNNAMAVSVGPNAVLAVGLAPGANEAEAMIGVFNYGDQAAIVGAGSVAVGGGTLAVWADRRASEVPLTRAADVFCMVAGSDPETAKAVDAYNGEAYVLVTASVAPVTPGTPFGPFTTPEAATNAMKKAVLAPRDDVEAALGSGAARQTYCNMFGFAVTGGGESWSVEAVLYPEAWSNVIESAQAATRQIPVADIAALPTDGKKDVSVTNCVPGFYYTLYGAAGVRALPEGAVYGPELSGVSGEVTFPDVVKPSAAAGFFSIGVKEAPSVTPSDRAELDPPARMGASGLME